MTERIRPPTKCYGGKYYLAAKIVGLLPEHETYVEPFGGGASVEVYNDVNGRLVRVLREHGGVG